MLSTITKATYFMDLFDIVVRYSAQLNAQYLFIH